MEVGLSGDFCPVWRQSWLPLEHFQTQPWFQSPVSAVWLFLQEMFNTIRSWVELRMLRGSNWESRTQILFINFPPSPVCGHFFIYKGNKGVFRAETGTVTYLWLWGGHRAPSPAGAATQSAPGAGTNLSPGHAYLPARFHLQNPQLHLRELQSHKMRCVSATQSDPKMSNLWHNFSWPPQNILTGNCLLMGALLNFFFSQHLKLFIWNSL